MPSATEIRLERNPEFWRDLLEQPDVRAAMRGLDSSIGVDAVIGNQSVLPFASENGGYIFVRMDPFGTIYDLHALYSTEGRGREAHGALKAALDRVNADLIVAFETDDTHSRPPLSFGFKAAGECRHTSLGPVRTWILTREAWEASKARARLN